MSLIFLSCGGDKYQTGSRITRESGVLNLLEPSDNVMVDRGFDNSDIVPSDVKVKMFC